jgi:hypothetical protein
VARPPLALGSHGGIKVVSRGRSTLKDGYVGRELYREGAAVIGCCVARYMSGCRRYAHQSRVSAVAEGAAERLEAALCDCPTTSQLLGLNLSGVNCSMS